MSKTLQEAIESIAARFRSGNRIPVDKAQVPAEEWHALVAVVERETQSMSHKEVCGAQTLHNAVDDALNVLGTGACCVCQCQGCAYERKEAVRILTEARATVGGEVEAKRNG